MVSQRLAQNYQLVVSKESPSGQKEHVLALGHIFHAISYDEIAQNITVKRFHLKLKSNIMNKQFKYHYSLWPVNNHSFIPSNIDIDPTGELQVNWNAVDQLISGESDSLYQNLRLWRINLVLLPGEKILPSADDAPSTTEGKQALEKQQIDAFINFSKNLFKNRLFKGDIQLDITTVRIYFVSGC